MTTRIDAKGKVFTDVVHKTELPVVIQTASQLIHGHMYLRPGDRLIDEMNREDRFVAVTGALIYGANGEALQQAEFLTLNKAHVVWIRPDTQSRETTRDD